jgi:hypothetical protein
MIAVYQNSNSNLDPKLGYINTSKSCVLPNMELRNDIFQFTTFSSSTLVFISYTKFFSNNSHHVPTECTQCNLKNIYKLIMYK